MDLARLLNGNLQEIAFSDVESFCQLKIVEGIQLDYKRELSRDLPKIFAAFTNTRGGVLIFGVEEDTATGLPAKWEGISSGEKLEERISQAAANVSPLPRFEFRRTDEQSGKVFLLVRILEGDETPYYVLNNANLYVRTGNVTKLVDLAEPDYAELLFGRKEKAAQARQQNEQRTNELFEAALCREEKKKAFPNNCGRQAGVCRVVVQPFYPKAALCAPSDILSWLAEFNAVGGNYRFWNPSFDFESIQYGLLAFVRDGFDNGFICEQAYANGLLWIFYDAVNVDGEKKQKDLFLIKVVQHVITLLKGADIFYRKVRFHGNLCGELSLTNIANTSVHRIGSDSVRDDPKTPLLGSYKWPFILDTAILSDPNRFTDFLLILLKDVYWSLGYQAFNPDAIRKHLNVK